jgi:hypothetical protein
MNRTKPVFLLSILSLALASLACTVFVGGPDYPSTPIPISTEAVANLEQQVQSAQTAAAESGLITITITETQATSLLAAKLNEQADPFLSEPQVSLRNGEIQVYGKATQGNLQANVRIVLSATLDPEGKPLINVTSADFGPLPAPEGLNNTISAFISQAFTGSFGPAATGLRLENITIADGVMTLSGRIK